MYNDLPYSIVSGISGRRAGVEQPPYLVVGARFSYYGVGYVVTTVYLFEKAFVAAKVVKGVETLERQVFHFTDVTASMFTG